VAGEVPQSVRIVNDVDRLSEVISRARSGRSVTGTQPTAAATSPWWAAARRQLEYVYYALRDHHVRALHTTPPAAA
jgi:hypothetical protein